MRGQKPMNFVFQLILFPYESKFFVKCVVRHFYIWIEAMASVMKLLSLSLGIKQPYAGREEMFCSKWFIFTKSTLWGQVPCIPRVPLWSRDQTDCRAAVATLGERISPVAQFHSRMYCVQLYSKPHPVEACFVIQLWLSFTMPVILPVYKVFCVFLNWAPWLRL